MPSCTERLAGRGRQRRRLRLVLPAVVIGWFALAAAAFAGETAEEFWPEIDVWIRS